MTNQKTNKVAYILICNWVFKRLYKNRRCLKKKIDLKIELITCQWLLSTDVKHHSISLLKPDAGFNNNRASVLFAFNLYLHTIISHVLVSESVVSGYLKLISRCCCTVIWSICQSLYLFWHLQPFGREAFLLFHRELALC